MSNIQLKELTFGPCGINDMIKMIDYRDEMESSADELYKSITQYIYLYKEYLSNHKNHKLYQYRVNELKRLENKLKELVKYLPKK